MKTTLVECVFLLNQLESHYWDGLYINQNNPGKGRLLNISSMLNKTKFVSLLMFSGALAFPPPRAHLLKLNRLSKKQTLPNKTKKYPVL